MNTGRYGFTLKAGLQLDELSDDMAQLVKDIAQALPVWVDQNQVSPSGYDEFEKPFYKAKFDEGKGFSLELEFHLQISRMFPKRAIIRDIVVHH